jgi:antitoxin (DNA-binding transcriptional repressor) of toxin-antitoxin stability system
MTEVSIRELRNEGGSVIERVLKGELITITRSGSPVAELRALGRAAASGSQLLIRWQHMPVIDHEQFRHDVDEWLDPVL